MVLLLGLLQGASTARTRRSGLHSRGNECCSQITSAAGSHPDLHQAVQQRPEDQATSLLHSLHASAAAQLLAAATVT